MKTHFDPTANKSKDPIPAPARRNRAVPARVCVLRRDGMDLEVQSTEHPTVRAARAYLDGLVLEDGEVVGAMLLTRRAVVAVRMVGGQP
jgi:hypothetical protein